jgi:hypothetical protein
MSAATAQSMPNSAPRLELRGGWPRSIELRLFRIASDQAGRLRRVDDAPEHFAKLWQARHRHVRSLD